MPKYRGPYKIIELKGPVTVVVQISPSLTETIHVERLKEFGQPFEFSQMSGHWSSSWSRHLDAEILFS